MDQNGSKQIKMDHKGSKWILKDQNGPHRIKADQYRTGLNGSELMYTQQGTYILVTSNEYN